MGIYSVTASPVLPQLYQPAGAAQASNAQADDYAGPVTYQQVATGDSGSVTFATVQGGLDVGTLVALGVITAAQEQGLQYCTTLVGVSYGAGSSVSVSGSRQTASTASSGGSTSAAASASTSTQVSVQASGWQGEGVIREAHILTADDHPIDLLFEGYIGSDGKSYSRVCLENLDPAGVIQNIIQSATGSNLTADDLVFASRQAYNQVLQLLMALPLPSESQSEETTSASSTSTASTATASSTSSTSTQGQETAAAGTGDASSSKDSASAGSRSAESAANAAAVAAAGRQQAADLYDLLHSLMSSTDTASSRTD